MSSEAVFAPLLVKQKVEISNDDIIVLNKSSSWGKISSSCQMQVIRYAHDLQCRPKSKLTQKHARYENLLFPGKQFHLLIYQGKIKTLKRIASGLRFRAD